MSTNAHKIEHAYARSHLKIWSSTTVIANDPFVISTPSL
jgi:hypothetical protein